MLRYIIIKILKLRYQIGLSLMLTLLCRNTGKYLQNRKRDRLPPLRHSKTCINSQPHRIAFNMALPRGAKPKPVTLCVSPKENSIEKVPE